MIDQEINEAVARKLGWSIVTSHGHKDIQDKEGRGKCLPDYCRSIEAAWEIVDRGFLTGVQIRRSDKKWIAGRLGQDIEDSIPADTAPMAICVNFLDPSNG